jgi:hypothetical protein
MTATCPLCQPAPDERPSIEDRLHHLVAVDPWPKWTFLRGLSQLVALTTPKGAAQ